MKKALKISTYILIVCGIVALGLCFIIIPERTRAAIDVVVEWFNTPIGIFGGSTITLGLVAYIVFKFIVTARKNAIQKDISDFQEESQKKLNELKQIKLELENIRNDTKVIVSDVSKRIDYLTNEVVKICKTSPNAKINNIANELVELKDKLDNEFTQKQELAEKYSDKELDEIISKIADLEKVVKTYGERKETTND